MNTLILRRSFSLRRRAIAVTPYVALWVAVLIDVIESKGTGDMTEVLLTILVVTLCLTTVTGWLFAGWLYYRQDRLIGDLDSDITRLDHDIGELWQATFHVDDLGPPKSASVLPFVKRLNEWPDQRA